MNVAQVKSRPELEALPERMRWLPVDERGYPVPWFVGWLEGKPEFRAMDAHKWERAVKERLCWVCGQKMGAHLAFVVGPMCLITGTASEPPSHLGCAQWSARNCPFLSRSHMVRRENDMPEEAIEPAGIGLARNPGVAALYVVRRYKTFTVDNGKLIEMPQEFESVEWWSQGRPATREEVLASVDSGLPLLLEVDSRPEAVEELAKRKASFMERLLPKQ